MAHIHEPVDGMASQVATIAADIAWADWPSKWSALFPTLLAQLDAASEATAPRVLHTLHAIVKRLGAGKVSSRKRAFFDIASKLFLTVAQLAAKFAEVCLGHLATLADAARSGNSSAAEGAATALRPTAIILRWASKIACHLLRNGSAELAASAAAREYLSVVQGWSQSVAQHLEPLLPTPAPDADPTQADAQESLALGGPAAHTPPIEGAVQLCQNLMQRWARTLHLALQRHPVPLRGSMLAMLEWALQVLPCSVQRQQGTHFVVHRHRVLALPALQLLSNAASCTQFTYPTTEAELAAGPQASSPDIDPSVSAVGGLTSMEAGGGSAGLTRIPTSAGTVHVVPAAAQEAGHAFVRFMLSPGSGPAGGMAGSASDCPSRAQLLVEFLLSSCVPPRVGEVHLWSDSPREFLDRSAAETPASSVAAAALDVLQALVMEPLMASHVTPRIVGMISLAEGRVRELSGAGSAADGCTSLDGAFLQLDGAYQAAGTLSFALQGSLDVHAWFAASLQGILQAAGKAGAVSVHMGGAALGSSSPPPPPGAGAEPSLALPSAELSQTECSLPLAHRAVLRRVLWLITCYEMPDAAKPDIFAALAATLRSPDSVLRSASRAALRNLLEGDRLVCPAFHPYMLRTIESLLLEVTVSRGLQRLLEGMETLTELLKRLNTEERRAVARTVVPPLPALWQALADTVPVRKEVLSVLEQIVHAAGADSLELHPVAVPMLAEALHTGQGGHALTLSEDALPLWGAMLESAPQYTAQLHALWEFLPPLAAADNKDTPAMMQVYTGYLLLGGDTWASQPGTMGSLQRLFASLVGTTNRRGTHALCKALEQSLTLLTPQGATSSSSGGDALGIFDALKPALGRCLLGAQDSTEPGVTRVAYLSVLARCFVLHQDATCALVREFEGEQVAAVRSGASKVLSSPGSSRQSGKTPPGRGFASPSEDSCLIVKLSLPGGSCHLPIPLAADGSGVATLNCLLDAWLDSWDNAQTQATGPWRRKLWALAMSSALPLLASACVSSAGSFPQQWAPPAPGSSPRPGSLGAWDDFAARLEGTVVCVTGLYNALHMTPAAELYLPGVSGSPGLKGASGRGKMPAALRAATAGGGDAPPSTPFGLRQQEVWQRDVAVAADVREVLLSQLQAVRSSVGSAGMDCLLRSLDPEALRVLQ